MVEHANAPREYQRGAKEHTVIQIQLKRDEQTHGKRKGTTFHQRITYGRKQKVYQFGCIRIVYTS